jgi:hypothetical protein
MTDLQIVEAAVNKAAENGYWCTNDTKYFIKNRLWEMIIFDHEFAEAFWGVEASDEQFRAYSELIIETSKITRWQYYLQKMVVKENPIKYLEQFL